MNTFLAEIVAFIHAFIGVFVLLVPLFGEIPLLFINFIFMLGIGFHWKLNDSTCCLTLLEQYLRNEHDRTETFFGRIFGKVYSLGASSNVWWYILILLLVISMYKIFSHVKKYLQK